MAESLSLTRQEVREIAHAAADETIKSLFEKLGIDYSNTRESQRDFAALRDLREMVTSSDFIEDMKHLRRWRLIVNSMLSKILMIVLSVIVIGLCAFIWQGFVSEVERAGASAGSEMGATTQSALLSQRPSDRDDDGD